MSYSDDSDDSDDKPCCNCKKLSTEIKKINKVLKDIEDNHMKTNHMKTSFAYEEEIPFQIRRALVLQHKCNDVNKWYRGNYQYNFDNSINGDDINSKKILIKDYNHTDVYTLRKIDDDHEIKRCITPNIEILANLKEIDLSYAGIIGSIPDEIGNLVNLTTLNLSNNKLNRGVPSLKNLIRLKTLDLSYNNLESFYLSSVPLLNLEYLDLQSNRIWHNFGEYDIKDSDTYINIKYLNLSSNNFSGKISSFISKMINLESLLIEWNSFIDDDICKSIYELPNIKSVNISNNEFSGPILIEMLSIKYRSNKKIDLGNNNLRELTHIQKLKSLD